MSDLSMMPDERSRPAKCLIVGQRFGIEVDGNIGLRAGEIRVCLSSSSWKSGEVTSARMSILAVVSLLVFSASVAGQTSFREHSVGLGTYVSLPSRWILDSAEQLAQRRERSTESLRMSSVEELRRIAAENENAIVFRAHDPDQPANSVNMNVTVNKEMKVDIYDLLTAPELGSAVVAVCDAFVEQARDAGGRGRCIRHELITLEDRRVLVIHQDVVIDRLGLSNDRTVALIPADGVLFTISISLRHEDYDPALPRAILASVRFAAI